MLPSQRQAFILDQVRLTGAVRVAELVEELGVSDMTVRRDLELLEQRGLLIKVHGGAVAVNLRSAHEPGFALKSVRQQAEKDAISSAAIRLVEPGTAVGLSAGTTTFEIAKRLTGVPELTVVTNSIPVAEVLYEGGREDQTVVLTGGIRTLSDALVGPFAVASLRTVHLDIVFLGVHGMNDRGGLTTPNMLEAETDQALIAAARRLVVVADHTKWEVTGISSIAGLEEVDVLITDSDMDPEALRILREHVGELVVVTAARSAPRGIR